MLFSQVGHERIGLAVLLVHPPIVPRCLITGPFQTPSPRCTCNHQHHYHQHHHLRNCRARRNIFHHRIRSRRGAASSEGRAASTGAVGKGTAGRAVDRRRRCQQPGERGVLAVGTCTQYQEDKQRRQHQHRHKQQCPTTRRLCQRKNIVCSVLSLGNRLRPLRLGSPRNMPSRKNSKRKERKAR